MSVAVSWGETIAFYLGSVENEKFLNFFFVDGFNLHIGLRRKEEQNSGSVGTYVFTNFLCPLKKLMLI